MVFGVDVDRIQDRRHAGERVGLGRFSANETARKSDEDNQSNRSQCTIINRLRRTDRDSKAAVPQLTCEAPIRPARRYSRERTQCSRNTTPKAARLQGQSSVDRW